MPSSHRSIGKTNSLVYDLEKVKIHLALLVLNAEDGAMSKYNSEVEEIEKLITILEEIHKRIVRNRSKVFIEYRKSAVWSTNRKRTESEFQSHHQDMAIKQAELNKCIALEVENYGSTLQKLKNSIQALEPQREMKDALDNIVKNLELILANLNADSSDTDLYSSTGTSNLSNISL